jgi:hypothetical protein
MAMIHPKKVSENLWQKFSNQLVESDQVDAAAL